MKKCNILFRCDGSTEIGMGHVVRCLALADELHNNYACRVTFAMRQAELGIQKVKENYPVITAEQNEFNYGEWLTNCIVQTEAEILVMDMRDGLSRNTLREIKQATGVKVVTIDDPEDKRLEADMAFYPPVPQVKEMDWSNYKGKLYTGWEYVILRKEFFKKYSKPKNTIPHILVSMGATDPKNMTEFVVEALEHLQGSFLVNIVVGEGYQYKKELSEKLSKVKYSYKLFINPPEIVNLMAKSDLAIISFGQTAYELTVLGIKSLYFCLTKDHCKSASVFEESGYGNAVGLFSTVSENDLLEILFENIRNISITLGFRSLREDLQKEGTLIAKIITENSFIL